MSAIPKYPFSGMGIVENLCIAVGIIQISLLVTGIRRLLIYVRHILFSDIGYCQPCQITCSCLLVIQKHPYYVLEFFKCVIRCQKNLTNETCYISAHIQSESTISGRHIGKMVPDIRKFFHNRSQQNYRKSHQAHQLISHRSGVTRVNVGSG
jgi:hypothetical protein